MPGPIPQPTALRVLRGNPRKRPLPPNEPEPERGLPSCPRRLSRIERAAWRRFGKLLCDMQVLTVADGPQLELLVTTYAEWREWDMACKARQRADGHTYKPAPSQRGREVTVAYPEFAHRAEAAKRLRALLADFGMNPSARSRVTKAPGGGGDEEGGGWKPGRKGT
jgi:P27 family predicted phage terminase small subunit